MMTSWIRERKSCVDAVTVGYTVCARARLSGMRGYSLEFETRLTTGEIKQLNHIGIIYVSLASKFIETWQANHRVSIFVRYDFAPNSIRNIEIEFILAFTNPTALPLESTWNASLVFYPHRRLHRFWIFRQGGPEAMTIPIAEIIELSALITQQSSRKCRWFSSSQQIFLLQIADNSRSLFEENYQRALSQGTDRIS